MIIICSKDDLLKTIKSLHSNKACPFDDIPIITVLKNSIHSSMLIRKTY